MAASSVVCPRCLALGRVALVSSSFRRVGLRQRQVWSRVHCQDRIAVPARKRARPGVFSPGVVAMVEDTMESDDAGRSARVACRPKWRSKDRSDDGSRCLLMLWPINSPLGSELSYPIRPHEH